MSHLSRFEVFRAYTYRFLQLQDGDEIQFGKTVHRVEGKSDATTACHNPLRVRVTITQPSEQPKVTIKPEPVSPEKPGKFMSHTFSFSAGGESEDDERSVLKKALKLNQSTAIVKAPISDSTASTADKSDMSISENDEDDAANQFTFSSPPLPSQTPRTDLHSTTGGKTLPSAERAKRRYTASPEGSEDEQGGEVTRRKGNATLADIREHAKRRYTSSPENSENENEEDEEEEVEHDDEAEEDPFSSSRPSSPDTTMKPDDTASLVEAEQGSEHSSFGTQKTSEEEEKDSSMSEDVKMTAEDGQTAFSNEAGQDAKAAVRKSTEAQITENKSAVDVLAARSSTPDSAKLAPVRAATHCETSQQTLAGRTIHLFEPQFLPTISPTLATNNVATSVLVPDSQEVSSSLSSNKITQTTLYGFFKPTNTVLTASSDAATTASQSDEEGQSDTSERTTSPSPEQHKSGTSSAPVQVIGKRKRDEEIQEVPVEVTQPFKPIKKARRGLSLRSAVSHTVSLAAGAVMAVALLSVMPDLDA
jgi:hypothetical protein